jgi:hypothetical protein
MKRRLRSNPAMAFGHSHKFLPHSQLQHLFTLARERTDTFQVVAIMADCKQEEPQPCNTMARDPQNEKKLQPTNHGRDSVGTQW